jgi:hypothetical protein
MSASSRNVSIWLLVILLPISGYIAWRQYHHYYRFSNVVMAPAATVPPARTAASPASNFPHIVTTEEQWIVGETARDIAEMLLFAKAGKTDGLNVMTKLAGGSRQSYEIRAEYPGGSVQATLQRKDFIWSPAEYAPWAEKLQAALTLAPAAEPTNDRAILQTLTSPTPQVLRQESKRISEALTKAPLDAGLHEQAALVTAAFAMREAAGNFSDARRELCRITAHLAIAEALQPESTNAIRGFADAALQTIVGREAPALALLAKLENDNQPGAGAWKRALRIHNSTDWRQVGPEPTLLEERETFFARAKNVNSAFAVRYFSDRQPVPVDDWRRIVLEVPFDVERGHMFAREAVEQEIASLQSDWTLFFGGELPDNALAKGFGEPRARSAAKGADGQESISVLGWDLWSAQHQRHLCEGIQASIHFHRDLWGVDDYLEVQDFARKNFSSLVLFPTLERELANDANATPGISQRVNKLLTDHPEMVPPAIWGHLRLPAKHGPALGIIAPEGWLNPPLPFGTSYNIWLLQDCVHLRPIGDGDWWGTLTRLAPSDYDVLQTKLWSQYGNEPPVEATEATYAPIKDINLWALRKLAKVEANHSPLYLGTMKRLCELDPVRYFELGDYYVGENQPEQAVEAYQKGVEQSPDRVAMANECGWLVNYLDDHGQAEKALAIANEAAEVYSYDGLETMAKLQEKHGHFAEAKDYYQKIAERYGKGEPLRHFLNRRPEFTAKADQAAAETEQQAFVATLTKVAMADFKEPPVDGAVLTSTSPKATEAGLRVGDIIVALDGYRIRTGGQYIRVSGLTEDPKMQLIVWNSAGYREVSAQVPGRHFDFVLRDYNSAAK